MNIFEKMSAISAEIPVVPKNLEVGFGKSKYKAVGEVDILRAVKDIEHKHGVYSYPVDRQIIESEIIDGGVDENGRAKKTFFERMKTTYRFVNTEKPDEYIDIVSYGDGIDTQDKGVGKAMTYADKYALIKAYKIATGEDPDQDASGDIVGKKISEATMKQADELGINMEAVAAYLKKPVGEVTEAELIACIARKRARKNG